MANDYELKTHKDWIGFVQPVGLVVTAPALIRAGAYVNRGKALLAEQEWFRRFVGDAQLVESLPRLLKELLRWGDADVVEPGTAFDVVLAEYQETLRPTHVAPLPEGGHVLLQQLAAHTSFDELPAKPEGWHASPQVRFERLLRETGNPVGVLSNGDAIRLVFAPSGGETAGSATFKVADMCEASGRDILGALQMLLHADRVFTLPEDQRLLTILKESRRYQNEVSTKLAEQVLAGLQELLRGFEAADAAVKGNLLRELRRAEASDELYGGLLTTILRLVFVLYAEDRGLMPQTATYLQHYSVTALFESLRDDESRYPDVMDQRFGAWARLVTLFRLLYRGGSHADFALPKRHGELFDPNSYPFLEGRPRGSAFSADKREKLPSIPRVPDGVVLKVLRNLLVLDGERLSYRALDVEQIGSVYESMMGFALETATGPSLSLRPKHVVVNLEELLASKKRGELLKAAESEVTGNTLKAVQAAKTVDELVVALDRRISPTSTSVLPLGSLYLQPGEERRRSGSHYTPRSLTEPIVSKTLRPIIEGLGSNPTPDEILALKVCDPAMGSGAFLVEACRFLGDALKDSWARHGETPKVPPDEDVVLRARRLVAQRSLYGVDKNPFAVNLAKLSLWLFTLAKDHPFTFLDHALKCGDSLVGLSKQQIARFTWEKEEAGPWTTVFTSHVAKLVRTAEDLRIQIHAIGDPPDTTELESLHRRAEESLEVARGIGDLVVASFFAEKNERGRRVLLEKLSGRVHLLAPREAKEATGQWAFAIRALVDELRSEHPEVPTRPFHWELEFPEVFGEGRDGFDSFVGNPPFMGGTLITGAFSAGYLDWLKATFTNAGNRADLVAYFFRRLFDLLCNHGTMGLIATNTVAQGDTREVGLKHLLLSGGVIYSAVASQIWPGTAAVAVSLVHVAKGRDVANVHRSVELDGRAVTCIDSRLTPKLERADATHLIANREVCFGGSKIYGQGFILTAAERDELVAKDPRNADRIYSYLGGEEANTDPRQAPHRFVIDFGQCTLEEAERWPDLMHVVRSRVKPERDTVARDAIRQRWWQFADWRVGLHSALSQLPRCIVTAEVTKHFVFSFQPPNFVFSHKLYVFALDSWSSFGVLQSRQHEHWVRLLSSTLEERLSYAPSDCFENFPFPAADPRKKVPALEAIGQRLYESRAAFMLDKNQGLTTTYNQLKDPNCRTQELEALRALHLNLDRAVLEAYGWTDLTVPPYTTPETEDERAAQTRFEDEVLDRLFALNATRAAEEASSLPAPPVKAKPAKPKAPRKTKTDQPALGLQVDSSKKPARSG
ncbi:MAG: N-6 DNA methylase [Archangium sp.]|nr:N-6 DNA methylase [Archangium sp.]